MTRTAVESDLYRQLQGFEDNQRQAQQGILQGQQNPYIYEPCDYAATGNVVLTNVFTSITDVAPGAATVPAFGGMRILLWQQTNKIENGIYEVGTDNFLHRAPDMPPGSQVRGGARIYVIWGSLYGNRDFFVIGGGINIAGSTSLLFSPPRGTVISEQVINGTGNTYLNAVSLNTLYRDNASTQIMRISYTPPVDCWWELDALIGIVYKTDAAYGYAYWGTLLAPADVDGIQRTKAIEMQNSSVNTYAFKSVHRKHRLVAGVAYSVDLYCDLTGGGTWQYNNSPDYLTMGATARVR